MAPTATHGDPVPIKGYDKLEGRDLYAALRLKSQDELALVDSYERSHQNRAAVLDKLRYLRNDEPLDGYDRLDADGVVAALGGSDMPTLGAVRTYEVKLRDRPQVLSRLAELRRESYALRGAGATVDEPADAWAPDSPDGFRGVLITAGTLTLVALAAILMLVFLFVLVFVILTAVAPTTFA
jgi:hypothetical protein